MLAALAAEQAPDRRTEGAAASVTIAAGSEAAAT
jgi:hypothetical protein